jgi:hypothetical protein
MRLVFDGIDDQLLLLCRSAVLSFVSSSVNGVFAKNNVVRYISLCKYRNK